LWSDGERREPVSRVKLDVMTDRPEWNLAAMMQSPMLASLHPVLGRLARMVDARSFPSLQVCNALLETHEPRILVGSGAPLRFVAQEGRSLPFEAQYEPRCYLKGELQSREDNWHDLFNALAWLTFPRSKAAINARHYQTMVADRKAGRSERGHRRDMLTLLDESGVIVPCADGELAALLREFRWKELFWHRRPRLADAMGFCVFGHGLCEKILRPYVGMTAQGLILSVEAGYFEWPLERQLTHLDALLAAYLSAPGCAQSTRELTPVPLLGVPGWSAESCQEYFYDNARYFRPGRLLSYGKSVRQ